MKVGFQGVPRGPQDVNFAAPGMDGTAAAAAEGLSGLIIKY